MDKKITSRELVKKTIEFADPERIPRQLWSLPWSEKKYPDMVSKINKEFPADIMNAPLFLQEDLKTEGDQYSPGLYKDEWGCVFENKSSGIIGEVKNPIISNWDQLNNFHIPAERLTVDIDKVNDFCSKTDKFIIAGGFPRIFERLQFLRRTENLYMDLVEKPSQLTELMKTIHDFYKKELKIWAKTDVDALFIMDDWGAQNSLLINPVMWRNIFKPLYKEYIEIAKSNGKYVFMHSDGYILDILPDLIEIGVDAINCQIFCMGIENLAQFAGKITFWGEIDRQHLLPYATRDEIKEAVIKVKENLWNKGGCIAQCEFGPGANPENVYTVFATWDSL